ncbi:MAG TPA: hypothetical protein VHW96_07370 [Solirubrobacteraceae bacterium]|jgi:hypothetical protein|nr:hypothetical protein [Solirubrobacteraceae bacterium]
MRAALVTTVLAAAVLIAAGAAGAASAAGVRPGQIVRAVRSAEQSRSLWATVNICDTRRYRNDIGVRGQMPSLGFSSSLYMVVQVNYWASKQHRFLPIQSNLATTRLSLGSAVNGLEQDGAVFPFSVHTGLLNATFTFIWTRGGKVIGQTVRRTTAGHADADHGSPAHYSAAQCRVR